MSTTAVDSRKAVDTSSDAAVRSMQLKMWNVSADVVRALESLSCPLEEGQEYNLGVALIAAMALERITELQQSLTASEQRLKASETLVAMMEEYIAQPPDGFPMPIGTSNRWHWTDEKMREVLDACKGLPARDTMQQFGTHGENHD